MTNNTIDKLREFINQVENLTAGVTLTIGVKTASEILMACHELKMALRDERPQDAD